MFNPRAKNVFRSSRNPTPPGLVAQTIYVLGMVAVFFACNAIFSALFGA